MRSTLALGAAAGSLLLIPLSALAPAGAAAPSPTSALAQAARRTAAVPSLQFDLTDQMLSAGQPPYVLNAHGALAGNAAEVAMKVANVRMPSGQVLTGPSADERTDGTFLYLRSSVTSSVAGGMWIRERLGALTGSSPELRALRAISPRALVLLLARAHDVRRAGRSRVYHAILPYTDTTVAQTLGGLEAGTQYRRLRLTAWVSPQGRVLMLLLSGRTADGSSTFLLALTLGGFDRPVSVRPPRPGSFVDFDLSRLAE